MKLKKICRSLLVVFLAMQSITLMAQNQTTISGSVSDESGLTLPGVNIRVKGKVIGLQETWCNMDESEHCYEIEGYNLHLVNQGRGKGVATYYSSARCL